MPAIDRDADEFERTDEKLKSWGYACRENSKALGLPTISAMSAISARMQSLDTQRKGARKTKRRRFKIKEKGAHGEPRYQKTAEGEQSPTRGGAPELQLSGEDMTIDKIVSRLPNWAKKCLYRSYMYNQPDRKAAEEMRMRVGEYSQRRRAAVEQVAIRLKQRYVSACSSREL